MSILKHILHEVGEEVVEEVLDRLFGDYLVYAAIMGLIALGGVIFFAIYGFEAWTGK